MTDQPLKRLNLQSAPLHAVGVGLVATVLAWLLQARIHTDAAWESALRLVLGDVYASDAPLLGALGRAWIELRWATGAQVEGIQLLSGLDALSAGLAAALLYLAMHAWLGSATWSLVGVALALGTNAWWGTAASWGPMPALVPLCWAAWRLARGLAGTVALDRRWQLEVGLGIGLAATLDRSALWLLPGLLWVMHRRTRSPEQTARLGGFALAPFVLGWGIGGWLGAMAGEIPPLPTIATQNQADEALARLAGSDSASFSRLLTPLGSLVDTGDTLGLIAALVPLAGIVGLGVMAWRHRDALASIDLALPVLVALPLALFESALGSAVPLLPLVPLGSLATVALARELGPMLGRTRSTSLASVGGIAAFMALANVGTHLAEGSRWSQTRHRSVAGDAYFPSELEAGDVFGASVSFPSLDGGSTTTTMGSPEMGNPGMYNPGGMGNPGMYNPGGMMPPQPQQAPQR